MIPAIPTTAWLINSRAAEGTALAGADAVCVAAAVLLADALALVVEVETTLLLDWELLDTLDGVSDVVLVSGGGE